MYNSYIENGVIITPNVIAEGDRAKVLYKGLLFNSGADSVYMHTGYGDNWENTDFSQMNRINGGFESVLPITEYKKLNIVFKDSASNWDNNHGVNYSFEVEAR